MKTAQDIKERINRLPRGEVFTPAIFAGAGIQGLISDLVPEKDRPAIVSICADALQNLHEGSVSRYRLKRDEFFRWHLDHGSGEGR